jgi:hypothetical protein
LPDIAPLCLPSASAEAGDVRRDVTQSPPRGSSGGVVYIGVHDGGGVGDCARRRRRASPQLVHVGVVLRVQKVLQRHRNLARQCRVAFNEKRQYLSKSIQTTWRVIVE